LDATALKEYTQDKQDQNAGSEDAGAGGRIVPIPPKAATSAQDKDQNIGPEDAGAGGRIDSIPPKEALVHGGRPQGDVVVNGMKGGS